ncbi:MAG: ROK family protein [Planctomycetia bacterium]
MSGRAGLGVEIGGTKIQVAVVRDDGAVVAIVGDRVTPAAGAEGVRRSIAALVEALVARCPEMATIAAAGIGFGGPVDRTGGQVATSFHVAGWDGFPLAVWLAELVGGRPVAIENDANAAAFAEATVGAGRGGRSVLYSNAGSGVGGGFVSGGRLFHGEPPGELEIGHLRLDADGTRTEDVASGWALDRAVRAEVAAHPEGPLGRLAAGREPSAVLLGAALAGGDEAARRILAAAAAAYALALSHAVHLLHPEVIVLGGGVARLGEPWRAAVADRLPDLLMEPFRPGPAVRLAALGDAVVPVGAALLALG